MVKVGDGTEVQSPVESMFLKFGSDAADFSKQVRQVALRPLSSVKAMHVVRQEHLFDRKFEEARQLEIGGGLAGWTHPSQGASCKKAVKGQGQYQASVCVSNFDTAVQTWHTTCVGCALRLCSVFSRGKAEPSPALCIHLVLQASALSSCRIAGRLTAFN